MTIAHWCRSRYHEQPGSDCHRSPTLAPQEVEKFDNDISRSRCGNIIDVRKSRSGGAVSDCLSLRSYLKGCADHSMRGNWSAKDSNHLTGYSFELGRPDDAYMTGLGEIYRYVAEGWSKYKPKQVRRHGTAYHSGLDRETSAVGHSRNRWRSPASAVIWSNTK